MQVDIEQLKAGMKYLDDNGNSYVYQAIKKLNSIDSMSFSNFKFNIGSYTTDINKYFAEIARIKNNLIDLNEKEFGLMTNASETYNYILKINGEGDYSANDLDAFLISNGEFGDLTKDKIILLTYNLANGVYGEDNPDIDNLQRNSFMQKTGYSAEVYNLIKANLLLQNKTKFNSAYDVSFNVPVPTLSDDGRITGFEQMENKKYNKAIADMVLLNNDFFSDARNWEATYKSGETGNNVLYIYNYLVNNFGYTDTGAKAILANMMVESYVKPTTKNREGAFGLCQWLGDRRKKLETYAADNHLDINSIDTQLEFMNHELSTRWNDNRGLYASLIGEKETDFTTLTKDFCAMYEIPSDIDSESIQAGYNRASYESADAVKNLIDEYVNYQPEVEVVNQYYSDLVNQ